MIPCNICAPLILREGCSYVDIEFCKELSYLYALRWDLIIDVFSIEGNLVESIWEFANVFSAVEKTPVCSLPPLLAIASNNIFLADPVTGFFGVYSLNDRKIVFNKFLSFDVNSIASAHDQKCVVLSNGKSGHLVKINATWPFGLEVFEMPSGRLWSASWMGWAAINTTAAELELYDDLFRKTQHQSFLPTGALDGCKTENRLMSVIFASDVFFDGNHIFILNGRGGSVVPSFWTVDSSTNRAEKFILIDEIFPSRLTGRSGRIFLLCSDRICDSIIQIEPLEIPPSK